ncbi:MAG: hypothetical protein IKU30_01095 [Clostridia bacterium]|nr:hypothetical protein [Clostridia bacterium]
MEYVKIDAKTLGIKKRETVDFLELHIGICLDGSMQCSCDIDRLPIKVMCGKHAQEASDEVSQLIKDFKIEDFCDKVARAFITAIKANEEEEDEN